MGDSLTFLYLCQVMANKMKLGPTDQSQEMGTVEHFPVSTLSHCSIPAPPSSLLTGLRPPYLLSPGRVVCGLCFVERPLLVSVIINPLTKMVPNVKTPGGTRRTLSPQVPRVAGRQRWRPGLLPRAGGPQASPVVVAAVLEVNQHDAVSVFWL